MLFFCYRCGGENVKILKKELKIINLCWILVKLSVVMPVMTPCVACHVACHCCKSHSKEDTSVLSVVVTFHNLIRESRNVILLWMTEDRSAARCSKSVESCWSVVLAFPRPSSLLFCCCCCFCQSKLGRIRKEEEEEARLSVGWLTNWINGSATGCCSWSCRSHLWELLLLLLKVSSL